MKAWLVALTIPPFGLVTLIVIGLLLGGRWRVFGRCLVWLAVVALVLLATPIVSHTLLIALEHDLPTTPPTGNPPAAIVVLGAEVMRGLSQPTGEKPGEPLAVRPGLLTLDRLRSAAELGRATGLPILVSGGVTEGDTPAVGTVMAASLRDDFRIPARWVEDRSADTWENARFSAAILRPAGITSVYVVTSAWHMRRAVLAFQDTGLTVTAAPTALDDPMAPDLGDFMPRTSVWLTGYYALHEWIGYEWYTLRRRFDRDVRLTPAPANRSGLPA